MHRYMTISRLVAILALTFAGIFATSNGANAAARSKGVESIDLYSATPPPPGPSGCNGGNWCTYSTGGGSNLCQQFDTSQNLSSTCASTSEGAFDNSSDGVSMFAGQNDTGAYYYLAPSDYLLYEADNTFNQCTNGTMSCGDYGGAIEHHNQSTRFN